MIQPVFYIKPHAPVDHLFIEVGKRALSVCARDAQHLINGLEVYELSAAKTFAENYAYLENQSDLLKSAPAAMYVICNNQYATCIPKSVYSEEDTEQYRHFLNAPLLAQDYLADRLDFFIKYFIQDEILQVLKKKFNSFKITHKHAVLHQHILQKYQEKTDGVFIQFYEKEMLILTVREGALVLINTYKFSVEEDVLYHLFNIFEIWQFELEETPLFLSGMISDDSSLYQKIKKYFRDISFDNFDNIFDDALATGEFGTHFFTPYLSNIAYFSK